MKTETKSRMIGLDILRILSMVLITLRHFIGYAELTKILPFLSLNGFAVQILDIFCGSAVNIFVLISGYFLIGSTFKWSRAMKVWAETFFYSVLCFGVAAVFRLEPITSGKMMLSFLPLLTRHYWFTVAYLALYAVSPFLNKLLNALSEKEYTVLAVGGAVLLSLWTSVVYFSEGVLTGGNTGLLWFIYLYILGGYIKLYRHKFPKTGACLIATGVLVFALLGYNFLSQKIGFLQNFSALEDDSIFELALSVLLFLIFQSVSCKCAFWNKIVVFIASCSFGVYLIQESCMLRQWLWHDLIKPDAIADRWYLIPVAVSVVIGLFVAALAGHKIFALLFGCCERLFCKKNRR